MSLLYSVPASQRSSDTQHKEIYNQGRFYHPHSIEAKSASTLLGQEYGGIIPSYDSERTSQPVGARSQISESARVCSAEDPSSNSNYTPYASSFHDSYPGSSTTLPTALEHNHHNPPMIDIGSSYGYSIPAGHDASNLASRILPDTQLGLITEIGEMMIESQDVDMNALQDYQSLPFFNSEWVPWLEYLPQEVIANLSDQYHQHMSDS